MCTLEKTLESISEESCFFMTATCTTGTHFGNRGFSDSITVLFVETTECTESER